MEAKSKFHIDVLKAQFYYSCNLKYLSPNHLNK